MLRLKLPLGVIAACLLLGCGGTSSPLRAKPKTVTTLAANRVVTDDAFGQALTELLRADRRAGKQAQLASALVKRQLHRARLHFSQGENEAGLATVRGALLLLRAGELRSDAFEGASDVLVAAAEEASRLGSEGRARALYSLVLQSAPPGPVIAATREHLKAMDRFGERPGKDRALERLGDEQRVAVERSLYEPTAENVEIASRKIVEWINAALVSDALSRWGDSAGERQEAIEAYRAPRFGTLTLVATHLRQGDPMGALDWLARGELSHLAPETLRQRLEQAGQDDEMSAWVGLYQFFQSESDPNRADSPIGSELAEAAALGAAMELYRSEPRQLLTAGPLALLLADYHLGEAVPLMIRDALSGKPGREELSWALSLSLRAILIHGEAGDIAAVRRMATETEPLFVVAEEQVAKGMVLRPHPSRLLRAIATFEARVTDLDRARAALSRALRQEPTASGYVELGRVERQRGDQQAALECLGKGLARAKSGDDALGAAEVLTAKYELLAAAGDRPGAELALREALRAAMGARDVAQRPAEQAQAERRFARVLEHYGRYEGAMRATARALEAARSDRTQLVTTILDSARRAFVAGDLRALRLGLRDAQELGLGGDDCVYVAVWLRLLEQRRQLPSDGTVEELWAKTGELRYWPDKLRAWMRGQLTIDQLEASARRELELVEARFYRTLSTSKGTLDEVTLKALATIADSRAVGLVEVGIAQDLIRAARFPQPPWPEGVAVP